MILPIEAETYEMYIRKVRSIVDGTVFDFIPDVYEEYEDFTRYVFKNRYSLTPDNYIGSEIGMVIAGFNYDTDRLQERDSYWGFTYDFIDKLRSSVVAQFSKDQQYLRALADLYSNIIQDDSAKILNSLKNKYEQSSEELNTDFIIPKVLKRLKIRVIGNQLS